ncbi:hypothetical protein BC829DRAFT_389321 [Chytridium lagenaria]|nr:hypothetical protein BC829DRAFT_389321 [Chytridium lagenaria]
MPHHLHQIIYMKLFRAESPLAKRRNQLLPEACSFLSALFPFFASLFYYFDAFHVFTSSSGVALGAETVEKVSSTHSPSPLISPPTLAGLRQESGLSDSKASETLGTPLYGTPPPPANLQSYQSILQHHFKGWQSWADDSEKGKLKKEVVDWLKSSMTPDEYKAILVVSSDGKRRTGIPTAKVADFLKQFKPLLESWRNRARR